MQGAKPKANLAGLPGLATRPRSRFGGCGSDAAVFGMHGLKAVRARKTPSRWARPKTGPLPTKFLARAASTCSKTLAGKPAGF
jgi:hypothetical protein